MKTSTRSSKPRFTAHDRRRLGKALAQAISAALYRRLQAVWLVASGRSRKEAARITQQTDRSVRRQVKRYLRSRSVHALADRARSGRPRQRDVLSARRLRALLSRSPMALGYRSNVWTCRTLAQHLAEHDGVKLSPCGETVPATGEMKQAIEMEQYGINAGRGYISSQTPSGKKCRIPHLGALFLTARQRDALMRTNVLIFE